MSWKVAIKLSANYSEVFPREWALYKSVPFGSVTRGAVAHGCPPGHPVSHNWCSVAAPSSWTLNELTGRLAHRGHCIALHRHAAGKAKICLHYLLNSHSGTGRAVLHIYGQRMSATGTVSDRVPSPRPCPTNGRGRWVGRLLPMTRWILGRAKRAGVGWVGRMTLACDAPVAEKAHSGSSRG